MVLRAHLPRISKAKGKGQAEGGKLGHLREKATNGPVLQSGLSLGPQDGHSA